MSGVETPPAIAAIERLGRTDIALLDSMTDDMFDHAVDHTRPGSPSNATTRGRYGRVRARETGGTGIIDWDADL